MPPFAYQLTLERPNGIKNEAWQVIDAQQRRLALALETGDHPLCIGTAKELVEAIAKGLATQLGAIRNAYGTGHGRSEQPAVTEEMVHLCLDGALLWSRWALRRLGVLTLSMPEPLIQDLEHAHFRRGDLAKRLDAAGLAALDPPVQRRIGLAVAQRAMRETFVVRHDGVEECARSRDLTIWPAHIGARSSRGCSSTRAGG
jgi:hypothetical protein